VHHHAYCFPYRLSQAAGNNPIKPTLKSQKSLNNLTGSNSSIAYPIPATRPVPPRYPMRPPSPPSSHGSVEDATSPVPGSRSQEPSLRSQSIETTSVVPPVPKLPGDVFKQDSDIQTSHHIKQRSTPQVSVDVTQRERGDSLASKPSLTPSESRGTSKLQIDASVKRPVPPSPNPVAAKSPTADEAKDIRRQLARATSADECRLLMDMFLARAGLGSSSSADPVTDMDVPYPSPQPSEHASTRPSLNDRVIETALVEMLLGGNPQPVTLRERAVSRPSSPRSQGESESGYIPSSVFNQPLPPLPVSTIAQ
jgi:hypothetical protein